MVTSIAEQSFRDAVDTVATVLPPIGTLAALIATNKMRIRLPSVTPL
jgi:hypothetical protein